MIRFGTKGAVYSALVLGSVVLFAPEASAQASRTWVSGVGDDANPCSRTAPCKTFAGAISKTAAAGEIDCLDPGGFGAVTVTKSMTLDCTPVQGGVLAAGTNGINVVAAATDTVVLRGLNINGFGTGLIGVRFTTGGTLIIENSTIRQFNSGGAMGIQFAPSGASKLLISNVQVNNNGTGGGAGGGIIVAPSGTGSADVSIVQTNIENNPGLGLQLNTTGTTSATFSRLTLRDSQVVDNGAGFISVTTAGSSRTQATLINSTVSYNTAFGVASNGSTSQVWLSGNTITGNNEGLKQILSGQLLSFGDNVIFGNGSSFTPTPFSKQ